MKIGLLVCTKLSEAVIRQFGSIADMYCNMFNRHAPEIELEVYDAIGGDLPNMKGALSGFLCTGSPSSAYEDHEWIKELKKFVKEAYRHKKKMVGICFGHQIIAEALGGKVARASRGWGLGVQGMHIHQTRDWMKPGAEHLNMLVIHQDQVTLLPPDGVLLAGNSHCRYFMYEVPNVALGIQGHPEFEKDYAEALYTRRRDVIGHDIVSEATSSLSKPVHTDILVGWICRFFRQS